MKKIIVIGLLAALGCASCQQQQQEQVMDEETLQRRLADACYGYNHFQRLNDNARERVLEGGVPPEWVTEALEKQIRKHYPKLMAITKREDRVLFTNGISNEYSAARDKVTNPIIMLREFPGPDTLTLMLKYAKSTDYVVARCAVDTYIAITGGGAVPFLREYVSKDGRGNIHSLSQRLRVPIKNFKENNRNNDAAKLNAFLLEHLQEEEDWSLVRMVDEVLLKTLDGHAGSDLREQAYRRFGKEMPEAK